MDTSQGLQVSMDQATEADDSSSPGVRRSSAADFRAWLFSTLSNGKVPGCCWMNEEKKMFKLPWDRADHFNDHHAMLMAWANHIGQSLEDIGQKWQKYSSGFKSRLNNVRGICEVTEKHHRMGTSPCRVFRMKDPDKPSLGMGLRNRAQLYIGPWSQAYGIKQYEILRGIDILRNKTITHGLIFEYYELWLKKQLKREVLAGWLTQLLKRSIMPDVIDWIEILYQERQTVLAVGGDVGDLEKAPFDRKKKVNPATPGSSSQGVQLAAVGSCDPVDRSMDRASEHMGKCAAEEDGTQHGVPPRPVDVLVSRLVERPVSTPLDMPVSSPEERPDSSPLDMPVSRPVERPVSSLVERPVSSPLDMPVSSAEETPDSSPLDMPVSSPVERLVSSLVDRSVDRPVDMPVSSPMDGPVYHLVDRLDSSPVGSQVSRPVGSQVTKSVDTLDSSPGGSQVKKPVYRLDSRPVGRPPGDGSEEILSNFNLASCTAPPSRVVSGYLGPSTRELGITRMDILQGKLQRLPQNVVTNGLILEIYELWGKMNLVYNRFHQWIRTISPEHINLKKLFQVVRDLSDERDKFRLNGKREELERLEKSLFGMYGNIYQVRPRPRCCLVSTCNLLVSKRESAKYCRKHAQRFETRRKRLQQMRHRNFAPNGDTTVTKEKRNPQQVMEIIPTRTDPALTPIPLQKLRDSSFFPNDVRGSNKAPTVCIICNISIESQIGQVKLDAFVDTELEKKSPRTVMERLTKVFSHHPTGSDCMCSMCYSTLVHIEEYTNIMNMYKQQYLQSHRLRTTVLNRFRDMFKTLEPRSMPSRTQKANRPASSSGSVNTPPEDSSQLRIVGVYKSLNQPERKISKEEGDFLAQACLLKSNPLKGAPVYNSENCTGHWEVRLKRLRICDASKLAKFRKVSIERNPSSAVESAGTDRVPMEKGREVSEPCLSSSGVKDTDDVQGMSGLTITNITSVSPNSGFLPSTIYPSTSAHSTPSRNVGTVSQSKANLSGSRENLNSSSTEHPVSTQPAASLATSGPSRAGKTSSSRFHKKKRREVSGPLLSSSGVMDTDNVQGMSGMKITNITSVSPDSVHPAWTPLPAGSLVTSGPSSAGRTSSSRLHTKKRRDDSGQFLSSSGVKGTDDVQGMSGMKITNITSVSPDSGFLQSTIYPSTSAHSTLSRNVVNVSQSKADASYVIENTTALQTLPVSKARRQGTAETGTALVAPTRSILRMNAPKMQTPVAVPRTVPTFEGAVPTMPAPTSGVPQTAAPKATASEGLSHIVIAPLDGATSAVSTPQAPIGVTSAIRVPLVVTHTVNAPMMQAPITVTPRTGAPRSTASTAQTVGAVPSVPIAVPPVPIAVPPVPIAVPPVAEIPHQTQKVVEIVPTSQGVQMGVQRLPTFSSVMPPKPIESPFGKPRWRLIPPPSPKPLLTEAPSMEVTPLGQDPPVKPHTVVSPGASVSTGGPSMVEAPVPVSGPRLQAIEAPAPIAGACKEEPHIAVTSLPAAPTETVSIAQDPVGVVCTMPSPITMAQRVTAPLVQTLNTVASPVGAPSATVSIADVPVVGAPGMKTIKLAPLFVTARDKAPILEVPTLITPIAEALQQPQNVVESAQDRPKEEALKGQSYLVFGRYKINHLSQEQERALYALIKYKDVLFVATESPGQCLTYELLPKLIPHVRIFVVASQNTVIGQELEKLEYRAMHITDEKCVDLDKMPLVQFVFGHLDDFLSVDAARILKNESQAQQPRFIVVQDAHCTLEWGPDFKPDYNKLHKLRTLLGGKKLCTVLAMTSTATVSGQETITSNLQLASPTLISVCPVRDNLELQIERRDCSEGDSSAVKKSYEIALTKVYEDLKRKGNKYPITLIYFNNFSWCSFAYELGYRLLGNALYTGQSSRVRLYYEHLQKNTKEHILRSLKNPASPLRVVLTTEDFGLVPDIPNISQIIHLTPPSSLEAYVQQIGKAGHSGRQAKAVLYVSSGLSDKKMRPAMVDFCKNTTVCRRKTIAEHCGLEGFTSTVQKNLCCDLCKE